MSNKKVLSDDEMAALEASSSPQKKVLTDEEMAALEKGASEPGLGAKALDYAGRGLDALGGAARYSAAGLAQIPYYMSTGKTLTKEGDLSRVLHGQAPNTAEYMDRAGIGKGHSLSDLLSGAYSDTGNGIKLQKGGAFDPTVRGAVGFAGDVALDPLTYLSGGLSAAAKGAAEGSLASRALKYGTKAANAVVNPLEMLEKPGQMIYRSGLKNIDTRLVERGQAPVSDYLREQGIWGTLSQIQAKMKARAAQIAEERKGLYQKIDDAGVKIDPAYADRGARDMVSEVRANDYMAPKADSMDEFLDLAKNKMSVQKASDIKSSLYDALPASAFDVNGRLTNDGKKMLKELSLGYKNEIERAGNFVEPGLGDKVGDLNQEWGALISADKPTRQEIAKAGRKNVWTEVKSALSVTKPITVPMMYAAQAVNSPFLRTGAGLGLENLATMTGKKAALGNAGVRRSIYQSLKGE